jgi:hypothetical protein
MTLYNKTAGPGATMFDDISFLGATKVFVRNYSAGPIILRWDGLPATREAAPEGRSLVVGPAGSANSEAMFGYDQNGARVPDGGGLSVFSEIGGAPFSIEVD